MSTTKFERWSEELDEKPYDEMSPEVRELWRDVWKRRIRTMLLADGWLPEVITDEVIAERLAQLIDEDREHFEPLSAAAARGRGTR